MEKLGDNVQSWLTTVVGKGNDKSSVHAHKDRSVDSNYGFPFDNHLFLLLGSALCGSNVFTKQGFSNQ